ncbi:hypothetical protein E2C01_048357 [Portunus trituberculatus]|uniref:Uncharacterized protein n=1 Tax=Portunus trituberculatus TaxID=210409 RepID=A0A5B7G677_PORTR|nr:hypothetical protein [Portunus trituberculatus]
MAAPAVAITMPDASKSSVAAAAAAFFPLLLHILCMCPTLPQLWQARASAGHSPLPSLCLRPQLPQRFIWCGGRPAWGCWAGRWRATAARRGSSACSSGSDITPAAPATLSRPKLPPPAAWRASFWAASKAMQNLRNESTSLKDSHSRNTSFSTTLCRPHTSLRRSMYSDRLHLH